VSAPQKGALKPPLLRSFHSIFISLFDYFFKKHQSSI
jgi:hypothetical protein